MSATMAGIIMMIGATNARPAAIDVGIPVSRQTVPTVWMDGFWLPPAPSVTNVHLAVPNAPEVVLGAVYAKMDGTCI
jgi:hypothetical protein